MNIVSHEHGILIFKLYIINQHCNAVIVIAFFFLPNFIFVHCIGVNCAECNGNLKTSLNFFFFILRRENSKNKKNRFPKNETSIRASMCVCVCTTSAKNRQAHTIRNQAREVKNAMKMMWAIDYVRAFILHIPYIYMHLYACANLR